MPIYLHPAAPGSELHESSDLALVISRLLTVLALLSVFALVSLPASGQTNEWTWVGGNNTLGSNCKTENSFLQCGRAGVYDTYGTSSAKNAPGGRESAADWTDKDGNLWLFGGWGFDSVGNEGDLSDLWEFNTTTHEWTWARGESMLPCAGCGSLGSYGALGNADANNTPGGRNLATTWIDKNGKLWLFGGYGFAASGSSVSLNDLWEFDPSTREWTWKSGDSAPGTDCFAGDEGSECGWRGIYGNLGISAAKNAPGSRYGAVSWSDESGHLWLFGGFGFDSNGTVGYLNDLWVFDPNAAEWTWMGGSNSLTCNKFGICYVFGVYGTQGKPASGNVPGGRYLAVQWVDHNGDPWIFGGYDGDDLNDLWMFNIATREWTWMSGTTDLYWEPPSYGLLGMPAVNNVPGIRESSAGWSDGNGALWLFSGWGMDSTTHPADLNDLWEFNEYTREWTWMGGNSKAPVAYGGELGTYGVREVPSSRNAPGGRERASSWTDTNGNLWLFGGGYYYDTESRYAYLNDLWEYRPAAPRAPAPGFSENSGRFDAPQTIKLTDSAPGSAIYFSLDGGTPTNKSTKYTDPIVIDKTATLKAVAATKGYLDSVVETATYVILRSQAISFAKLPRPLVYGDRPTALSATASSGLPVELKVLSGPGTISGHRLTVSGAGTIVIAANQPGSADYTPAKEVTQSIVVDKATLTVTAHSYTIEQGEPIPTLRYTMTGFVNRDAQQTATVGQPKMTVKMTGSSPYPIEISAGTLKAKNYTFKFVDGTLTVK